MRAVWHGMISLDPPQVLSTAVQDQFCGWSELMSTVVCLSGTAVDLTLQLGESMLVRSSVPQNIGCNQIRICTHRMCWRRRSNKGCAVVLGGRGVVRMRNEQMPKHTPIVIHCIYNKHKGGVATPWLFLLFACKSVCLPFSHACCCTGGGCAGQECRCAAAGTALAEVGRRAGR